MITEFTATHIVWTKSVRGHWYYNHCNSLSLSGYSKHLYVFKSWNGGSVRGVWRGGGTGCHQATLKTRRGGGGSETQARSPAASNMSSLASTSSFGLAVPADFLSFYWILEFSSLDWEFWPSGSGPGQRRTPSTTSASSPTSLSTLPSSSYGLAPSHSLLVGSLWHF